MIAALGGRLAASALSIMLVLVASFALLKLAPGGPFDAERSAPPEVIERLEARYGLDQHWTSQLGTYLSGVLRGDLGPSYQYPDYTVNQLIAAALPLTLGLGAAALALAITLALPLSLFGVRPGWRLPVRALATSLLTLPKFVLAPLLILLFAVNLQWLPAGGWNTSGWHWVLPVVTLAGPQLGVLLSALLQGMDEALAGDAVAAARTRGLSEARVLWYHALPLALPLASACLPTVAIALFTGSTIVEQVFGLPGLGRLLVQAAINRDYTVVLGCVLVVSAIVALINLLTESIQRRIDPRGH